LQVLEGDTVHFPFPKNKMSNDVVLEGDTPFLATCDDPLEVGECFRSIDIFRVMNKETLRLGLGALLS
jgi:hypothetical protein